MNVRVHKQCRALIFLFSSAQSQRDLKSSSLLWINSLSTQMRILILFWFVFDKEEIKSSIKLPNFNFWVFFLILTASCNSNNHSTFGKTISQWKILTIQKKVNHLMKQQVTVTCSLFLGFFFSLWAFLCLFSSFPNTLEILHNLNYC